MVVHSPTLFVFNPRPNFGGLGLGLGPRRPGPLVEAKKEREKDVFVERLVPHEVFLDLLREERSLWYPGALWVHQFSLQTFPGKGFPRILSNDFPKDVPEDFPEGFPKDCRPKDCPEDCPEDWPKDFAMGIFVESLAFFP